MHSKQDQVEKLLTKRYGFVFKENINSSIGVRRIFVHLFGIEVSVSPYRVCFYRSATVSTEVPNPFPVKSSPACFGVDQKSQIVAYLEKTLAVSRSAAPVF